MSEPSLKIDPAIQPVSQVESSMERLARIPILFVTTRLGGGGAERHLVRIANALRDRYEVHIAVLRGGGTYAEFLQPGISIASCGPAWCQRSTLACSTLGVSRLRNLIEQIKPACSLAVLEPAAFTTSRAMKRSAWQCATAVCVQNNIDHSLRQFRKLPQRWLLSGIVEAFHSADAIISISEGVAGGVFERWPDLRCRRQTIHNAAFEHPPNVSRMTLPSREEFKAPRHLLVACGRLTEQKGFADLLEAMKILRQSEDVGLWLLGEGPLEQQLKQLATKLELGNSVRFLGFQKDPLPYFAAADLFVLSSWWEGFGNVLVEAMSVGTAVVSTDCPHGPSEVIRHGKNGVLVPTRSPEALASGILSLLKDPQKRDDIARAGKIRAMDFSAKNIADQYDQVISEFTNDREAARA